MVAVVFTLKHRGQVLGAVIGVNPVDVVNHEPGVQKVMMSELPDQMRTHDITALVGVRMLGTEYPLPLAAISFPRRFSARGDADNDTHIWLTNATTGVCLTTGLNRVVLFSSGSHISLYPGG